MAPSALDVGEHTLEPIEHWLDGIKAGFAEKFYWLFSGMGIEDTEDLRLMKAHRVAAMREDLVLEGCKPVTLDRLMDAVKAARRPPRRPGRRKKKVRQSTAAPSPRTLVVEKGDGGNWAFRVDEDRAKIWERMMHSPRARGPEPPPEPARPRAGRRRLHVEKVRGAWTWHLDDSRKKRWQRIMRRRPRVRKTFHVRKFIGVLRRPQRRGDELASPGATGGRRSPTARTRRRMSVGPEGQAARERRRRRASVEGGAGLYKPLRVNGVTSTRSPRRREEQERLHSNRKKFYVAPKKHVEFSHRLSEAVKRQRAWIEKKARKGADHGGIHFAAMKGHDLPGEDEKAKTPEGTPRSPLSATRSLRSAAEDDDAEEEEAEDLFAGLSSIARSVARS
ncbi:hypothetical protein JL722_13589 [Aureococcus anophagefferens]|nr:hypothetical protein JL722_13589 [Aureococcus anophagefferens]